MGEYFTVMTGGYQFGDVLASMRKDGATLLVIAVPWDFVAPHEKQARSNHGQSLAQLDSRGGLEASELVAVLEDRPFRQMRPALSNARLVELLRTYQAAIGKESA